MELCGQALHELRAITTVIGPVGVSPDYETLTTAGRPRYDIPLDQLQFLLECNFMVPQIASLLNISVRTVFRSMESYGLSVRSLL